MVVPRGTLHDPRFEHNICVELVQELKEPSCHLQKLRARRLSSLVVGLAPPRIAKSVQDASIACDIEDDDLHQESQAPQQLQQQDAANGSKPQHISRATVQKFIGSKAAAAAGRTAAAAASAEARPAACESGLTGAYASASAAFTDAGIPAQHAANAPQHGAEADARRAAPAAAPEQGVVAQDSLNDGQATAVRRCVCHTVSNAHTDTLLIVIVASKVGRSSS